MISLGDGCTHHRQRTENHDVGGKGHPGPRLLLQFFQQEVIKEPEHNAELENVSIENATYLQNIEAADAAFYNLNPGTTEFSVVFKRSTVTAQMDCSLISLSTGITKTFRLDITGKTT